MFVVLSQFSILNSQFSIMDYGLWIMDYGLWIMDYGLWIMDYLSQLRRKTNNPSSFLPYYPLLIPITYPLFSWSPTILSPNSEGALPMAPELAR
jgi:hypothetical protein